MKWSSVYHKIVIKQGQEFNNILFINNKFNVKCNKIGENCQNMRVKLLFLDSRFKDWIIIWKITLESWIMSRLSWIPHNMSWTKPGINFRLLRVVEVTRSRDRDVLKKRSKDWLKLFVHMKLKLHKSQLQFINIMKNWSFYHNKINA